MAIGVVFLIPLVLMVPHKSFLEVPHRLVRSTLGVELVMPHELPAIILRLTAKRDAHKGNPT